MFLEVRTNQIQGDEEALYITTAKELE